MKYALFICFCFTICSAAAAQAGYEEIGMSSYYSDAFQGRKTASGQAYDKNDLTCAHNKLAFGTMLRITNLKTGNSVIARVNDRGPYTHGRIVDVSRVAAEAIDMIKTGTAEVKIQVISMDEIPMAETFAMNTTEGASDKPAPAVGTTTILQKATTSGSSEAQERQGVTTSLSDESLVTGANFKKNGTYRIELRNPEPNHGFVVQVASLTNLDATLKEVARLQQQAPGKVLIITDQGKGGDTIFKLAVGPYADKSDAKEMQEKLSRKGFEKCFVTKD
jgi:rare lipoprotein A